MNKVTIIGLGYVGLPLTLLAAEKGLEVTGFDIDNSKIKNLKQSISPIEDEELKEKLSKYYHKISFTNNLKEISNETIIISVPTPIDGNHKPDLEPLKKACESIKNIITKETLVIIESTIFPGTTEEIVKPILGSDCMLAHCPERIDPGNKKYNIKNLPRVVAGIDERSTEKAFEFYKKVIEAEITKLSSVKAAEATKIMENTFRDINIAFVNEMAKSFDKARIDIAEVIKGASTKPFAFMPHYPGAGVGGHCIGVDPYYLIDKAKQLGFNHKFLQLARDINESMPEYTIELLEKITPLKDKKVGVLGLAYKPEVDDIRESPALKVIESLKRKSAEVIAYDPFIKEKSDVGSLKELLEKSDYLILVTEHKEFKNIDPDDLKQFKIKAIIDGRNCLPKEKIKNLGITYHGIGRS